MTNLIHLLSVAGLLLAAFLVGAVIGTTARVIALRLGRRTSPVVAAPAEAKAEAVPLVAAPIIAPLPVAPPPIVPEPAAVPVPDFAATLIALAGDKPPPSFIEATRARTEAEAPSRPEIRPVPALVPVPVVAAPATQQMQPAHVAGETTSGVHIAPPMHDAPVAAVEVPVASSGRPMAEVILFPTAVAEAGSARPTQLVVGGEVFAVVDAADLEEGEPAPGEGEIASESPPIAEPAPTAFAEDHFAVVAADASKPITGASEADTIPVPAIAAYASLEDVVAAALRVPEVVETAASPPVIAEVTVAAEPKSEALAEIEASEPEAVPVPQVSATEPEPEAVAPEIAQQKTVEAQPMVAARQPHPEAVAVLAEAERVEVSPDEPMDEDAAMRAIEGNWSPRRPPPRRPIPASSEPEGANQAVAASARAVIAARRTAEAIVAEVTEAKIDAGRPAGLDAPRDGRKDDLTHIIGVLPVIETALNKLGIFHFDQMGALTDDNIGWIEGHLGVPGRISRELWREQARELSAVVKPRRAAEK